MSSLSNVTWTQITISAFCIFAGLFFGLCPPGSFGFGVIYFFGILLSPIILGLLIYLLGLFTVKLSRLGRAGWVMKLRLVLFLLTVLVFCGLVLMFFSPAYFWDVFDYSNLGGDRYYDGHKTDGLWGYMGALVGLISWFLSETSGKPPRGYVLTRVSAILAPFAFWTLFYYLLSTTHHPYLDFHG